MKIRTKFHYRNHRDAMIQGITYMYFGHSKHIYLQWVWEGFRLKKRAFRCPGQEASDPESLLTTEQKILREVREINQKLNG